MSFAVIIPSKNVKNLSACVRAIDECEPDHGMVVVVNDGIPADWFFEVPVREVKGVKPFVYARNVNLGIAEAEDRDVILLNDDAILKTPCGLSALAKASREYPEFGIIASTTNVVGNTNQYPKGVGLREDPKMVCFVAVYIPRATINRVGLLDERYTAYGWEDNDYCRRIREAGLKIGIHDGCYVDHGSLVSTFRGQGHCGIDAGRQIYLNKWGSID